MISYSSPFWRAIGAAGFAAVLFAAQTPAKASMAPSAETVSAEVAAIGASTSDGAPATAQTRASETNQASPALPASGGERSVANAMAAAGSPVAKRHRAAISRPYRRAVSAGHDSACSGSWCRRHFVLMLGVGY